MPPQKRVPTAHRRPQIANTTLRLVGKHGLVALTMAKLAAEIGVTTGALFRHFASRDEILETAVTNAVARLELTFPEPGLPPLERLFALARARVRLVGSDPGLAWLLLSEEARLALPSAAVQQLSALVRRSRRFILAALREGADNGEVRADIEPETLLLPVVGTLHVLIRAPGVHRRAFPRKQKPEVVLAALRKLLTPPPPKKHNA